MIRALVVILVVGFAPCAHALSVCPTSDFNVEFATGDDRLNDDDLVLIEAAANRARQCNVDRIELIVDGDISTETSLSHRRATSVASELVERGLQKDTLQVLNEGSATYGSPNLATPDTVRVLIFPR